MPFEIETLVFEALDDHDVLGFTCGNSSIDSFLNPEYDPTLPSKKSRCDDRNVLPIDCVGSFIYGYNGKKHDNDR